MSTHNKSNDGKPGVSLDLTGKHLRRREQQDDALDPYDSRRTFDAVQKPREIFRRRREDADGEQRDRREDARGEPREQEKRIKFEIVDDPKGPKGGYNPYDAS